MIIAAPGLEERLIDKPRVEEWLSREVPQLGDGPLRVKLYSGGTTNAVFRIDRGGIPAVLRRSPEVPRPDSEKVLAREARVLKALNDTSVPAPRLLGWCPDRSVNGTVFYVMSLIDGWAALDKVFPPPFDKPGEPVRRLAFELVRGIAELAKVDYKAVGLEDFGKPANFLERQVDRWLYQLDSYRESENYEGRAIPGLNYVADWLRANCPAMQPPSIIHGDYGFANAMFSRDPAGRLLAMIDWELSTIGDPLLDLAWTVWTFRSRDTRMPTMTYFDQALYPYREQLIENYAEKTGLPVDNINYYLVLAQFKLGIILERKVAANSMGRKLDDYSDHWGEFVLNLFASAEKIARLPRP
jgi:aminoglycoside phosphotransferase (APT) family kinase protein